MGEKGQAQGAEAAASQYSLYLPMSVIASRLASMLDESVEVEAIGERVVCLHSPHRLSAAAKEQIFLMSLPYIARAFSQDMHSMDESTRLDHLEHTLGGEDPVYF